MQRVWTVKRMATGKSEENKRHKLIAESVKNLIKFDIIQKKIFEARKIEILSPEKMAVIIPGQKRDMEGFSLISQNFTYPNPLTITIQRGKLRQNRDDPNKLMIQGEGMISISGEKVLNREERKEQPKDPSHRLPYQNKFLTSFDGMEFQQSGTLQVLIKMGAIIILS